MVLQLKTITPFLKMNFVCLSVNFQFFFYLYFKIGGNQRFRGIYNLLKDRKKKLNMLSTIALLEFPAKEIHNLKPSKLNNLNIYEEMVKSTHKKLYNKTMKTILPYTNTLDSTTLEEIYSNYK